MIPHPQGNQAARGTLSADEKRNEVPLPEIQGHVARHRRLVLVEGLEVSLAHRGHHGEAHVDELPYSGIEAPVGLYVAEGGDEDGTFPAVNLIGGGSFFRLMSMTST